MLENIFLSLLVLGANGLVVTALFHGAGPDRWALVARLLPMASH